ncbi:actin-related protein 2/3 complex subunit 5-like isoform X3 [Tyto alba]|uniref:actin-related protein 2/3 complex subunit 5-like isoform X3 n=1 Tax=Tyto alba TaxID=56313 RepID=UPI001C67CD94|nr:actin-related protein 2/3 complex subunit 5-like isoform X3 [Tyto alba]
MAALQAALKNPPINTKNQAVKDRAESIVLKVLISFKANDTEKAVQSLDKNGVDLLMKYIYKGFESPSDSSSAVLLQWHEEKGKVLLYAQYGNMKFLVHKEILFILREIERRLKLTRLFMA